MQRVASSGNPSLATSDEQRPDVVLCLLVPLSMATVAVRELLAPPASAEGNGLAIGGAPLELGDGRLVHDLGFVLLDLSQATVACT